MLRSCVTKRTSASAALKGGNEWRAATDITPTRICKQGSRYPPQRRNEQFVYVACSTRKSGTSGGRVIQIKVNRRMMVHILEKVSFIVSADNSQDPHARCGSCRARTSAAYTSSGFFWTRRGVDPTSTPIALASVAATNKPDTSIPACWRVNAIP